MKKTQGIFALVASSVLAFTACQIHEPGQAPTTTTASIPNSVCVEDPISPLSTNKGLSPKAFINPSHMWYPGETIRIKFLNGTTWEREQVKTLAPKWLEYANVKFKFVGDREVSDVRISFNSAGMNNSILGTYCRQYVSETVATMNLCLTYFRYEETILHEFGHVLGLMHEHQTPAGGIKWNKPLVYDYFSKAPYYMTKGMIDTQILNRYTANQSNYSAYDAFSIMHFYFPPELTTDRFYFIQNRILSFTDKSYISQWYPYSFSMSRWATSQGGYWFWQNWMTGDFNGDGKTDFAKAFTLDGTYEEGKAYIDVHQSDGDKFTIIRWELDKGWFQKFGTARWLTGDFNGDGKTDIAKVFNDGGLASVEVMLSSAGNKFVERRWATRQGGYWASQQWFAGDYDGDGKCDLAKVFSDAGKASIDVHRSTGSGFEMKRWATKQGDVYVDQTWLTGDFDGDKKWDIAKIMDDGGLASIDVHASQGYEFTMSRWANRQGKYNLNQKWCAGDYNGDGKWDLAKAFNEEDKGSIEVHISDETKFMMIKWASKQGGFWWTQQWMSGDFNGDEKWDLGKIFTLDNKTASIDVHLSEYKSN